MEAAKFLDSIAARIQRGEADPAYSELWRTIAETLPKSGAERQTFYEQLVERISDPSFRVGACFAIAAGALVEHGLNPTPLARAIRAPLTRALSFSKRCVELAAELEDEMAVEDGVSIGDAELSKEKMRELTAKDPQAVEAYFSMGTWYRPAVAGWTRDTGALREAQGDSTFRRALAAVEKDVEGGHWLALLSEVLIGAPFVVLLPELRSGYSFELSGCADVGQLTVLLSEALGDAFDQLGCEARATKAVVEVMSGAGPQSIDDSYTADFYLYPWRAFDPTTSMPAGGGGLPPDFLPSAIQPLDGSRVLLAVGPDGPDSFAFQRTIAASRMFSALEARIDKLHRLTEDETKRWITTVRATV